MDNHQEWNIHVQVRMWKEGRGEMKRPCPLPSWFCPWTQSLLESRLHLTLCCVFNLTPYPTVRGDWPSRWSLSLSLPLKPTLVCPHLCSAKWRLASPCLLHLSGTLFVLWPGVCLWTPAVPWISHRWVGQSPLAWLSCFSPAAVSRPWLECKVCKGKDSVSCSFLSVSEMPALAETRELPSRYFVLVSRLSLSSKIFHSLVEGRFATLSIRILVWPL